MKIMIFACAMFSHFLALLFSLRKTDAWRFGNKDLEDAYNIKYLMATGVGYYLTFFWL